MVLEMLDDAFMIAPANFASAPVILTSSITALITYWT
jgi:hypothetical protein